MQSNFQLTAEPSDEVRFEGDLKAQVLTTIKLTNKTQERKAFKVKCTRNDIFRIRPPVGTLEPDESTAVSIRYKYDGKVVPEGKRHHFAIYHIAASKGVIARAAWRGHQGEADGVLRMWAVFKEGPAQPDSKKEDEFAKDGTPPHLMSDIKKPDESKPNSKPESKPEPKQEPKPQPKPEAKSEPKPEPAPENPDGPKKPEEAVQTQQAKKNDPQYATLIGLDPFEPKGGAPKIVIKAPANPTRVDPKADQYKTLADLDKVSFTDDKKFKPGEFKAPAQPKAVGNKAEYATLANLDAQQVFDTNKKDK